MIAGFHALTAGWPRRPAAPGGRFRHLGLGALKGAGIRFAAASFIGLASLAWAAPVAWAQRPDAAAQAAAACRAARDALRDMVHRMIEQQTIRESCGLSEPPLQAAVGELEAYAAGRLAAMDASWPLDGIRADALRLRERKRLELRRAGPGAACAGQEPLEARLRQVAEARAVVVSEERPGGAFACMVR